MDGIVKIHGREYKTVALRVHEFKTEHEDWSIQTELVSADENIVVMKAMVLDSIDRVRGTGYAEENRRSSKINSTSAMENAETSAIGRALAACGFAGTEYASADEVANAITQQSLDEAIEAATGQLKAHNEAVRENYASIAYIKEGVEKDDPMMVAEAWLEMTDDVKKALWLAPTKGGVFTPKERTYLRSDEVNKARKEIINAV